MYSTMYHLEDRPGEGPINQILSDLNEVEKYVNKRCRGSCIQNVKLMLLFVYPKQWSTAESLYFQALLVFCLMVLGHQH